MINIIGVLIWCIGDWWENWRFLNFLSKAFNFQIWLIKKNLSSIKLYERM